MEYALKWYGFMVHGIQDLMCEVQFKSYNVKLLLCLTKHHAMKTNGGVKNIQLHTSLTLAPDGGEWSVSWPSCFIPKERVPITHCTED
jgi:hypothetical protein